MSNSLIKFEGFEESRVLALRPGSDYLDAIAANEGMLEPFGVSDLIRVKVPAGGGQSWEVEELSGTQNYKELVGIPVYYKPTGAIWPYAKSKEGSQPFIRTEDLVKGVEYGEDPGDLDLDLIEKFRIGQDEAGKGIYDWQGLRRAFWDVDAETGKRVKEGRLICLLRENDPLPILLRVPPTSLKNVTSFFKLASRTIALTRLIISLSLEQDTAESGEKYSRIRVKEVARLSKEEGAAIKQLWADRLAEAVHQAANESEHGESGDGEDEISMDGEPFVA